MGTQIPKIGKNGDTDPQNELKWGAIVATIAMALMCTHVHFQNGVSKRMSFVSHFSFLNQPWISIYLRGTYIPQSSCGPLLLSYVYADCES